MGNTALYSNTNGWRNLAMGTGALYNNIEGSGNVALGYYAGRYETGSNAFYVNNQDRTDSAGDKAKSLLYGVFAADPADQKLTINANVGIGTASPGATLDVNGTAKIARVLTEAQDSGVTLTTADFGKTITVSDTIGQTIILPSISGVDIGAAFTIIKLGSGAVTIEAASGNVIMDSSDGGSIYNDTASELGANVTIQVAEPNKWVIVGGYGTWTAQ
jgi:hypothetical protein